MRPIDADAIWYDQLLNTGNKEHPFEWAVSQSRIEAMPTIEAEVKHGKWIIKPHKMMGECPCCSACGSFNPIKYRYCPNCGAKMEEVEDGWIKHT